MSKLHLIAEKCDKKAEVTIIFNGDSRQANYKGSTSPRLIEESDGEKKQDFKSITVCSLNGGDCILYLDTSTMRMKTCPVYLPNGRTSKNYSTVWRQIPVKGTRDEGAPGFKLQNYITPGASLHMGKEIIYGKRNIYFSENDFTTFFYDGERQHFYARIKGNDGKEQNVYIIAEGEMFIGSDKIEDKCRWKLDDVLVDNHYPICDKSTISKL